MSKSKVKNLKLKPSHTHSYHVQHDKPKVLTGKIKKKTLKNQSTALQKAYTTFYKDGVKNYKQVKKSEQGKTDALLLKNNHSKDLEKEWESTHDLQKRSTRKIIKFLTSGKNSPVTEHNKQIISDYIAQAAYKNQYQAAKKANIGDKKSWHREAKQAAQMESDRISKYFTVSDNGIYHFAGKQYQYDWADNHANRALSNTSLLKAYKKKLDLKKEFLDVFNTSTHEEDLRLKDKLLKKYRRSLTAEQLDPNPTNSQDKDTSFVGKASSKKNKITMKEALGTGDDGLYDKALVEAKLHENIRGEGSRLEALQNKYNNGLDDSKKIKLVTKDGKLDPHAVSKLSKEQQEELIAILKSNKILHKNEGSNNPLKWFSSMLHRNFGGLGRGVAWTASGLLSAFLGLNIFSWLFGGNSAPQGAGRSQEQQQQEMLANLMAQQQAAGAANV